MNEMCCRIYETVLGQEIYLAILTYYYLAITIVLIILHVYPLEVKHHTDILFKKIK